MIKASAVGLLRYASLAVASVIAVALLHLFGIPTAWYIAFFLGFGAAMTLIVCWGIPVLAYCQTAYVDFEEEDNSSSIQEIARLSPDFQGCKGFIVLRRLKTPEFLMCWDLEKFKELEGKSDLSDWFSAHPGDAIVFDTVDMAMKVAIAICCFSQQIGEISVEGKLRVIAGGKDRDAGD